MKTVLVDCARLTQREAAYAYLRQALPGCRATNLDALYDDLTEQSGLDVVLADADALLRAGGYGARMVQTFLDAGRDNPLLRVRIGYALPGAAKGKEPERGKGSDERMEAWR